MPNIFGRMLSGGLLVAFGLTGLAACSSPKADATVAVTGTDKTCVATDTALPAGKIRFEITNKGKLTTELYVLGAKDRVIGEVENVLPGATSPLNVDLKAGTYELACKPGQSGDGIRQKITVSGAGGKTGAEAAAADATISVSAHEYEFSFDPAPTITKGNAVAFTLHNTGNEEHEFEVIGPDGNAIGEIAAIKPGTTSDATFEFTEAGTYTYQCLIKSANGTPHDELGMKGTFTVS